MSNPSDSPRPDAPATPSDFFDEEELSSEALAKEEEDEDFRFPWEEEPLDPEAPRQRHDGFTEAKKAAFLKALVKYGCIQDACGHVGITPRTVYRHQEAHSGFFENCRVALRMSGTPVEITAWQRAVEGVEQEFAVGGEVRVRRRYSEGLLRLLLQGSNPGKYGPRPGFKRKRLLKHERKEMEREVRAEMKAKEKSWSFDDAIEELERKLEPLVQREDAEKLASGWTKSPEDDWVPPGYAPIPGYRSPDAGEAEFEGEDTPRDSM